MQINFFNIARGAILGALAFTHENQQFNDSAVNKSSVVSPIKNDDVFEFVEKLDNFSNKIKNDKPLNNVDLSMLASFRKQNRAKLIDAHRDTPVYNHNAPIIKNGKLSFEPVPDEEIFTQKLSGLRKNYKDGITTDSLIETFGEVFIKEQASSLYRKHKNDNLYVSRLH